MIKLNDLCISLPETWAVHPFDKIILGSRVNERLGVLQILLGHKDIFQSMPKHDECINIVFKFMSKNKLPSDKNNIFQQTHGNCCLVGAFAYYDKDSLERVYYKYINNKFILAVYKSKNYQSNKDGVLDEIDESDSIIESIYFE
ncbi:MAG: hypothetical protein IMF17_07240 [Proteobacteria bacterium]|nr:hypothetical protein [Pseudomonadota bacterium]